MKILTERQTLINFFACIFTVCAFSMKLDMVDLAEGQPIILYLTKSFKGYCILQVFAIPVLYHYYKFVHIKVIQLENKREHFVHLVLSMLMAAFMLLGYSYEKNADWNLVINAHKLQWLKALIMYIGYFVFFDSAFAWLLVLFDRKDLWFTGAKRNPIEKWLSRYTYAKVFTIFILGYVSYIIWSYPAIVTPDTVSQIVQSYDELEQWTPYYTNYRHLSDDVHLNAHHPVVHTLLIHGCMEIGRKCFGSYNIGLFLYAFMQAVFQVSIFSAVVSLLVRIQVRWYWVVSVMLYYLFAPGIVSYVMLGTKDTLYASFTLLLIIVIFDMICNGESRQNSIFLWLSGFGVMLFRNDGKYVLMLSIVMIFISYKNLRKNMTKLFMGVLCISMIYSELLLPYFFITSGSKREMLSIPFQQTARYICYASDGITEQEQDIISAVLDYDTIAEKYDPERSDNVKGTYNESASKDDLNNYLEIWIKMFLKHPSHYLQATINNYYYYFYPGTKRITIYSYSYSSKCMKDLNERGEKIGMDIHYPEKLERWRNNYELIRNGAANFPGLSMIMSAATYTWGLLLVAGYAIAHKCKRAMALIVVPFVVFLICMAGPCNGWYYRYLYPVAVCLPLICFTVFYEININNKTGTHIQNIES